MELINPGIGVIFWMTLSFGIVLFILTKFAWKPIHSAIRERENRIEESLKNAEKVEKEIASINETKDRIISETNQEKIDILEDAKKEKERIIQEAKNEAVKEGQNLIDDAKKAIENEKRKARKQIQQEIAGLSIDMAEKILVTELSDKDKHKKFVLDNLENVSLN